MIAIPARENRRAYPTSVIADERLRIDSLGVLQSVVMIALRPPKAMKMVADLPGPSPPGPQGAIPESIQK
jgi:hypothetical protein